MLLSVGVAALIVLMFLLFYFLGAVIGFVLLVLGAVFLLAMCIYAAILEHRKDRASQTIRDSADTSRDL